MHRRRFLAAVAASGLPMRGLAADACPRPVTSDVGPLARVLVHPPGPETLKPLPWPALAGREQDFMPPEGFASHRRLVALLARNGVEVVRVEALLDEAIARCADAGRFPAWVRRAFPHLAGREGEITGAVLIGAADLRDAADGPGEDADEGDGGPAATAPAKCLFFARDVAAVTPRGVILGNFINPHRAIEPTLLRFALEWAPTLAGHRVVFDAGARGLYLQGGDVIVAGERLLLVGVGNLSESEAARRLAQALDMDVIGVRLPGGRRYGGGAAVAHWNALRTLFLHLDSVFNLLDGRLALAIPYLFERKYADRGSLHRIACAIRRHLGGEGWSGRELKSIGVIRRYRARSGEPDREAEGMKLVDYLKREGYEFVSVGGPAPESPDEDHLVERVLPELIAQAANVVALGPRHVIAFEGNPHTIRALEAAGVAVETVPGTGIARWHGGPHCLTMPLLRRPIV